MFRKEQSGKKAHHGLSNYADFVTLVPVHLTPSWNDQQNYTVTYQNKKK
jgi:hypothetical protein